MKNLYLLILFPTMAMAQFAPFEREQLIATSNVLARGSITLGGSNITSWAQVGGNSFNQSLNTTNSPTFQSLYVNGFLSGNGSGLTNLTYTAIINPPWLTSAITSITGPGMSTIGGATTFSTNGWTFGSAETEPNFTAWTNSVTPTLQGIGLTGIVTGIYSSVYGSNVVHIISASDMHIWTPQMHVDGNFSAYGGSIGSLALASVQGVAANNYFLQIYGPGLEFLPGAVIADSNQVTAVEVNARQLKGTNGVVALDWSSGTLTGNGAGLTNIMASSIVGTPNPFNQNLNTTNDVVFKSISGNGAGLTNILYSSITGTPAIGTAAYSNSTAFYSASNPSSYISGITLTNANLSAGVVTGSGATWGIGTNMSFGNLAYASVSGSASNNAILSAAFGSASTNKTTDFVSASVLGSTINSTATNFTFKSVQVTSITTNPVSNFATISGTYSSMSVGTATYASNSGSLNGLLGSLYTTNGQALTLTQLPSVLLTNQDTRLGSAAYSNSTSFVGASAYSLAIYGGVTNNGVFINGIGLGNGTNVTITSGNPFNQNLNTTNDVSFNSISGSSNGVVILNGSVQEGNSTHATGAFSHSEGDGAQANGYASHAEGYFSIAAGDLSHSEGYGAQANGVTSHAEGYGAQANGVTSHAEGYGAQANGVTSHAEGNATQANGNNSHAEGDTTQANDFASHTEGYLSIAAGALSHAEGYGTQANGFSSHAEGRDSIAGGYYSYAAGVRSLATNDFTYVWSGSDPSSNFTYTDNGISTFNVFATGGIFLQGGTIYGDGSGISNVNFTIDWTLNPSNSVLQSQINSATNRISAIEGNTSTWSTVTSKLATNGNGSALTGLTYGQISGTPTLGTAAYSNSTVFAPAGAYVTQTITNGLASTGFVTGQGYVTQTITNGLASTGFVTGQGYVTQTITNGLVASGSLGTAAYSNSTAFVSSSVLGSTINATATNATFGGTQIGSLSTGKYATVVGITSTNAQFNGINISSLSTGAYGTVVGITATNSTYLGGLAASTYLTNNSFQIQSVYVGAGSNIQFSVQNMGSLTAGASNYWSGLTLQYWYDNDSGNMTNGQAITFSQSPTTYTASVPGVAIYNGFITNAPSVFEVGWEASAANYFTNSPTVYAQGLDPEIANWYPSAFQILPSQQSNVMQVCVTSKKSVLWMGGTLTFSFSSASLYTNQGNFVSRARWTQMPTGNVAQAWSAWQTQTNTVNNTTTNAMMYSMNIGVPTLTAGLPWYFQLNLDTLDAGTTLIGTNWVVMFGLKETGAPQ